eukprot:Skav218208  [mRNA]  locus=scaffold2232:217651:219168:- [translate_table: standard]
MLLDARQADQWLQVTQSKVMDELALFVLGPIDVPSRFESSLLMAPAQDSLHREVILQGTLIQLGQKRVTIRSTEQPDVSTSDTIVASVTMWKADHDAATWEQCLQHPVRTVQTKLMQDGYDNIMLKPWGRQYQCDGVSVEPRRSTSMQFHAEFTMGPKFLTMLRRSGFNGIYMQPKKETGEPDNRWRIVWLGKEPRLHELEAKLANYAGVAGLVKTKRGMGIRVETQQFPTIWGCLFPDIEPPAHEHMKYVFKLHPVPLGVDSTVLKQWAEKQYDWRIKPLRSVGAKQWIISSNEIPSGILAFNTHPLILQQLPQKGTKMNHAVAAGPRMKTSPKVDDTKDGSSVFRTGDPHMDPWQPAAQARKQMNDVPTPAKSQSSSVSEPRSVNGPIADRLQQQDSRMMELEANLKQLKEGSDHQIQVLQQTQSTLQSQLNQHAQQTQQGFDILRNDHNILQRTVTEAMTKQEGKLLQTFEELKHLITNQRGQKRETPEQPSDEEDMTAGIL